MSISLLFFQKKIKMNFGINQKPMNGLTMVDLFCGAGIGAYGFKKAGFEIVYAIDSVQYAVDTYNRNIGSHAVCKNIKKIDLADLPYADVYTGGFPCQPFSLGGEGGGVEDADKGDLGKYFLEAVRLKQPKAFFAENVKGLVTKRHMPFFKELIRAFEDAGYKVAWRLSDCYEYGVPQIRERVLIVGVRNDLDTEFTFPDPIGQSKRVHIIDAIGDLPEPSEHCGVPNHNEYYDDGFSPRYVSRNRQRQWGEPSFTICSSARQLPLHPHPENYDIRVRDVKVDKPPRRFTVRECLRLQTVPDDFTFSDEIPFIKQHVRCSGIPSLVAYKISSLICEKINGAQVAKHETKISN
ncbi:DNA cytosine methyltransferase [Vibrio crassostreae]|uniref:DNA cytosine methyltransferase n=1 Tax=Vibrio crassostreae TaxID=246167 RepID=UPI001B3008D2|nr:DNA (cytosine-5-)-methyltransferase [Vibrio crassostreae]